MRSWAKRTRKRTAKNERSSSFSFSNSNETADSSSQPARTQQAGRQAKGRGRGGSPALQSKWERMRGVRKEGVELGFLFFFTTQNGQWGDLQDSMAGLLLLPPDKWGSEDSDSLELGKDLLGSLDERKIYIRILLHQFVSLFFLVFCFFLCGYHVFFGIFFFLILLLLIFSYWD